MRNLICSSFVPTVMRAVAILFSVPDASASPVDGTITLEITSGPLAPNVYFGSFSYDDGPLTGSGTELGLPDLGVDPPALDIDLELAILVEGLSYIESDDEDFPEAPVITIQDGVPVSLEYFTFTGGPLDLELLPDNTATIVDPAAGNSTGTYTLSLVPEPSAVVCLGVGLVALAFRGRRRA